MGTDGSCVILSSLAEKLGTSEPALRLLLSVVGAYPIALAYRQWIYGKNQQLQHIFFILCGFALGYWNYGLDILHPAFAVFFTYLTLAILGGTNVAVAITFLFNMAYLLIGYVYTSTENYDINWTMPHCVLVLRLIGVAYDLYDGRQPVEKLSEENKKVALTTGPSLLEFFGFTFFPGSFMVGPQFPLKRYRDFVSGKYSDENRPNEAPKSCVEPAIRRLLLGIFYMLAFQLLSFFVSDSYMVSDDIKNVCFFFRCFLLGVWGRYTLYKYMSCWLLAEGACVLFGLTHNGQDENGVIRWNGLANIDLWRLETATEFNHYIQSFNINTNHWVAQYIYKRLKFLGNRYVSQFMALLFLAIWHGFHTGYFVCFLFEFLVMYMEKEAVPVIKKNETAMKILSTSPVDKIVYILLRLYTFIFMGWCLLPFALLTSDRYWKAFANFNYMGWLFFGMYPIVYGPILRYALGRKKKREEKQE